MCKDVDFTIVVHPHSRVFVATSLKFVLQMLGEFFVAAHYVYIRRVSPVRLSLVDSIFDGCCVRRVSWDRRSNPLVVSDVTGTVTDVVIFFGRRRIDVSCLVVKHSDRAEFSTGADMDIAESLDIASVRVAECHYVLVTHVISVHNWIDV